MMRGDETNLGSSEISPSSPLENFRSSRQTHFVLLLRIDLLLRFRYSLALSIHLLRIDINDGQLDDRLNIILVLSIRIPRIVLEPDEVDVLLLFAQYRRPLGSFIDQSRFFRFRLQSRFLNLPSLPLPLIRTSPLLLPLNQNDLPIRPNNFDLLSGLRIRVIFRVGKVDIGI